DACLTGFPPALVTPAWVGYDLNQHPLNRAETGGRAALPIWLAYMKVALDGRAQTEFLPPADLDMVHLRIDNKTGKVAVPTQCKSQGACADRWSNRGTEPT